MPDAFFLHPPLLTEWLEANSGNEAETNESILQALSRGAKSIICNISSPSNLDIAQISNEVHTDMIEFGFNIKAESVDHIRQVVLPEGIHVRIEIEENSSIDVIQYLKNLFDHSGKDILISYFNVVWRYCNLLTSSFKPTTFI